MSGLGLISLELLFPPQRNGISQVQPHPVLRLGKGNGAFHLQKAGGPFRPPTAVEVISLFALVLLDLFLDFPLYCIQIESGWRLHWRKLDSRLCQFRYPLLHLDKAPEFSRVELI